MINIKLNSGITIVSLIITIIVMLILTGVTISGVKNFGSAGRYNNMIADITILKDKAFVYYNKYGEIPKTTRSIVINEKEYYEIDLSVLDGLTLNYGNDYGDDEDLTSDSDVYLIDLELDIYYLKGVKKQGEIYHK